MVDIADFTKATGLLTEMRQIANAFAAFDAGARIETMIISGPNTNPPNTQFWINTSDIDYPVQMIETIKTYLEKRGQQIHNELSALGVTGVEAEARR